MISLLTNSITITDGLVYYFDSNNPKSIPLDYSVINDLAKINTFVGKNDVSLNEGVEFTTNTGSVSTLLNFDKDLNDFTISCTLDILDYSQDVYEYKTVYWLGDSNDKKAIVKFAFKDGSLLAYLSFYDLSVDNALVFDVNEGDKLFGLIGGSTSKVFVEINGYLYSSELRQILVSIVGFYFGSSAASNKN